MGVVPYGKIMSILKSDCPSVRCAVTFYIVRKREYTNRLEIIDKHCHNPYNRNINYLEVIMGSKMYKGKTQQAKIVNSTKIKVSKIATPQGTNDINIVPTRKKKSITETHKKGE